MSIAVEIKNLDVIFGNHIGKSANLLDNGLSRQEIIDKTGDVVAVSNASLTVNKGEICVLMGLSGSGKSSLLRAVNGLNPITRGAVEIEYDGDMVDLSSCNRSTLRHIRTNKVSMVFQKFALMPWLTVLENVAFGLEIQGMNKHDREQKAHEQLKMVGLDDWAQQYPHELSGGMQQRVGLARAFAMDSDILLMDEPFSALDPLIRAQLQDELIELQHQLNKTIIFVSHDLDEALKLGSKIAIMESGKIIQYGEPETIVLKPEDQYVEDFVAHTNPLNVLRGQSLMTRLSELKTADQKVILKEYEDTYLKLAFDGSIAQVTRQEKPLKITRWQSSRDDFTAIEPDSIVVTDLAITMRDALELRYRSRQPVILSDGGQMMGILRDQDFYHALLGKHFGHCA
ncbi:choline ABC transporter ATP-binding protein [Celerinatantimonas diazotrophica]|uniref:Glycine betaine/proline transport system ATP-binding protein n=1 Tax=Celerinatantimonas diazotrophica TaxID=412034 RepID=A0A4R1K9Q0_9GAMM|nr:choline ABC transporter ATP-binding protein [Celerinatantimonas diazotrophica]TCK61084.1 glycine betaine/proline transport system ATP-binding protein [Celerinatantimonas diazotrophica]CAG9295131.1 Vitamin B12 import ATP-binding protein BtuD [Celerinatantimonas diazotrophica]